MTKSIMFLFAAFILSAATDEVLAQETQMGKRARYVRIHHREAVVYPNIRVYPSARTQTEVPIITHPLNPDIVLASANAVPPNGAFSTARLGFYYTTDGGITWSGRDTLPAYPARTSYDPVVAIDLNGNFFVGGVYRGGWEFIVAKSSDNGTTWGQTTVPTLIVEEDKPHMIVDVNQGSQFENYVYVGLTNTSASPWPVMFSRSTDGGANFSTAVLISGSVVGTSGALGVNLAVGPDGALYTTWSAFSRWLPLATDTIQLGFNKSTDGGATWQGAQSILRLRTLPWTTTKGGNCIRLATSFPSMAVDRSSGPRSGWVYITYPSGTATRPDIFLIRSTDGGSFWSAPVKVNQDTSNNDQWQPWITVDPSNGNLFVVYYDSRNFPANDSAEVYISASTDGGETFADILVSDAPFLPRASGWAGDVCYMGDYIGISALNGVVWPLWSDNRTGIHQAYTCRIEFPPTSVREVLSEVPAAFALAQNFPNPFNPVTTIQFSLPRSEFVTLKIFNILGEEIAVLVEKRLSAGTHEGEWAALGLPSGVYFYRLQAGSFIQTRKLVLLR